MTDTKSERKYLVAEDTDAGRRHLVSENFTRPTRMVPQVINTTFDLFMASIYIWFGALGTGTFLIIALVCFESIYLDSLNKEKSSE